MRATSTKELLSTRREVSSVMRAQQQQQQIVLTGPVAILWDIENCPVPSEVKAEDVAGNIRMALRLHPVIEGAVTLFSAYGDFNHFPRKVREGCQRTGVNLIDVPNGKKDASDKAILVDLFLFALDNPPPCTIFLISGDVDFAPALHKLGQRGYTVVLAIPSGVPVSSALCSAGRFVWYWPSVARGEGLVPAKSFVYRVGPEEKNCEISSSVCQAWSPSDDSDPASDELVYGEEQIVWKSSKTQHENVIADGSASRMVPSALYGSMSIQVTSQVTSQACAVGPVPVYWGENTSTQGSYVYGPSGAPHPSGYVKPSQGAASREGNTGAVSREGSTAARHLAESVEADCRGSNAAGPASLGGLLNLREQLVKLISFHGGKLELVRVPPEYSRHYGRPLYLAEYGYTKLVPMLEKMREWMYIRGEGTYKTLHLTKTGFRVAAKLKRDARVSRAVTGEETEVSVCQKIPSDESIYAEKIPSDESIYAEKIPSDESIYADNEVVLEDGVAACPTKDIQTFTEKDEPSAKTIVADLPSDVEALIPTYGWRYDSGDEKRTDSQEEKDVRVDDSASELVDITNEILEDTNSEDLIVEASLDSEDPCVEIRLQVFRQELQELLVSHACKICMASFLALYEQRYSRALDCPSFGVQELESLIEKVNDVAVLMEDPGSKFKYVVASCVN
ncbi:hypothetical protein MPTK1_6g08570 [Marchantia polymorpha subsp. ruderalis]|uniref:HTH OST-type domain-containing protein n=2 Tax=Marchantia polymorpha TaxID=3197 RepID=A0AAF6BPX9_MARPO|nr:hypothetical protein MARPO_0060s0064 [Marchantia polymorpha]BBN14063.1 hypothetical protein Mp_6g08570 [Marchantia polymorpha subsp. ruderalis]|eukprot:PTQ36982.1 hypothetical protein MARPO_0060s0064 [Marchantia polymorpha]